MKKYHETQIIGWRETVSLPDLELPLLRAKIDTGARTTALHASNIARIEVNGAPWVEFLPDHDQLGVGKVCIAPIRLCSAPIHHQRQIRSSDGISEERFIITTRLQLGQREAQVEVSLTDRSDMKSPIIVGRTAMRLLNFMVHPARSWLQSPEAKTTIQKEKK